MTVSEIIEQARALSNEERDMLIQGLRALQEPTHDEAPPVPTWSDDELESMLTIRPSTGAEIIADGLTGVWKDQNISDGAAWVENVRQKRRKRRQW